MTGPRDLVNRIAAAVGWTGSVSPELDWDVVEGRLGTRLPADYKQFMERFPSGMFRNSIRIFNPSKDAANMARFTAEFERILEWVRIVRNEFADFASYPPFPEPKGVIPFAGIAAGGSLFWVPWTADPDKWHVVYQSGHSPDDWTRTRRSMTDVMLEFVTSRSTRNILGWDMSERDRSFEPFDL
ncbi:SMI1/KNR4 family protein [Kibdelosporangium aridum]|uniref:SMI1/KNR4 family protein n=1 Tax=Kibdelosporangium aridum TaxID=2030 RepID=A0A1Y5Y787_KIBAR|nr:SMI1/KNR4 family protein [Kibdelosporangium aridum]SMD25779.1 hypothetical protein SAMN05661093_09358 [Kibdelosporangium aridum]